jgi:hypothetical protein
VSAQIGSIAWSAQARSVEIIRMSDAPRFLAKIGWYPIALSGMAWLHTLHVRSSLARARNLQAEYMLNGMRDGVCQLACLRCGVTPHQGRGLDDLPAPERDTAAAYVPGSLESSELRRTFQSTMRGLLRELEHVDPAIAAKLSGPLNEIVA